jgi:hypothetical protein
MSEISFTIEPASVSVVSNNNMVNVVKQITYEITGVLGDRKYSIMQNAIMPDPTETGFIAFADISKENMIAWIESHDTKLTDAKSIIETELNKPVLTHKSLPWAAELEAI